jgi:hypothetical protein
MSLPERRSRWCAGALALASLGLLALICLTLAPPAAAQTLRAYRGGGSLAFKTDGGSVDNARGATIGKIEGNSYYTSGGSLKARYEDRKLYNASGSQIVKFDGSSIYSARGNLLGRLDGDNLSNAHGATIGKIEGAGSLDDPATAFLACMLLGII